MERTLAHPPPADWLRKRAEVFSRDATVDRYLDLLFPPDSHDAVGRSRSIESD
jgi:hypothetical protein